VGVHTLDKTSDLELETPQRTPEVLRETAALY